MHKMAVEVGNPTPKKRNLKKESMRYLMRSVEKRTTAMEAREGMTM